MTNSGGAAFEKWWPLASASVDRLLRAHHVGQADRDDVVQEVAARAFVRQDEFTSLNHLTRWSCRVAANLRVDQVRRERRMSDADVPEWGDGVDTARLVEGRVALEAVLSAVSRLSETDRRALFGEGEPAEDRREAVKLAVRRHRARARLAAMVEGMIAALAVLNRVVLRRSDNPGVREAVAIGSVAIVVVSVPVIGALRSPSGDTPVRHPPPAASVVFGAVAAAPDQPAAAGARHTPFVQRGAGDPVGARAESARPVIVVAPVGEHGVGVDRVEPEEPRTLCISNVPSPGAEHCLDRPGPKLPLPPVPG